MGVVRIAGRVAPLLAGGAIVLLIPLLGRLLVLQGFSPTPVLQYGSRAFFMKRPREALLLHALNGLPCSSHGSPGFFLLNVFLLYMVTIGNLFISSRNI